MKLNDIAVPAFLTVAILGPGLMAWLMNDSVWLLGYVFTLIIIMAG